MMRRIRWERVLVVLLALLIVSGGLAFTLHLATTRPSSAKTPTAGKPQTQSGNTNASKYSGNVGGGSALGLAPHPTGQPTHTPTITPATRPTSPPNANPWQLVFDDEFNGTQVGPGWGTYNGPHAGGQSYYSPSEVSVQNGLLQISMERKTTGGLPYTTGGMGAFQYTQIYGKYEMRVKLPLGKGVGPYTILWPKSGDPSLQVDLFESPPATKSTLYCTNHGGPGGSSTQLQAHGNFGDAFHVLTYLWMPGKIQFLVDGVSQGILTQSVPAQPMWFGIAIATGDAFTGLPDSSTVLPVSMQVDYIHIYTYKP